MREAETWSVSRLHHGGGVSAGANSKIAETLVYSAEASSGRLIWCVGLEAVMTRAKLSVRCCF